MTLLIKNVRVLGTNKKLPETADVFVNSDKISAIGSFPNKSADEVIDGQGAYLAPGFIDVNTDSDHYLSIFDHPSQDDFLKQGVTTIVGGTCGSSLAPLLYGSLESIQKWGDVSKVNVDWHSLQEFLSIFDKKPLAVNFATLIGHSTIRRAIVGEQFRSLTKNELEIFAGTLRRAMKEGGFGFSTGLSYVHSYRTPYSEIEFLAKVAKEQNGIYATHLRKSGSEIGESIGETVKLSRKVGIKIVVNHFMPLLGAEKNYEAALAEIESLPADLDFHFDVYPSDTSVLALYTFLPLWVQSGGREVMLSNIKDNYFQPRIIKDFPEINPEDFILAQAPGNDFLVGRSLKELSKIYNFTDCREALLKLMLATELRGIVFYKNINEHLVKRAMVSKRSLIASNAASISGSGKSVVLKPERATSTFTKFLNLVESEKLMPLEEAIRKITIEPARILGLRGRGFIQEGNFADLVIFRNGEIKFVVVNGSTALKDAAFTGRFVGRALQHNAG